MPRTRASVQTVSTVLTERVRRDARAAAGSNRIVSAEEAKKGPRYLKEAYDELRAKGPRTRVTTDALETHVTDRAKRLLGEVNQRSGSGANTLSKAEATAAMKRNATLGAKVYEAWEIASGRGLDLDALAEQHVTGGQLDPDVVFKRFATEAEAMQYQDPDGRQVMWLVRRDQGLLSSSYTSGRNDLWAQRFDLDKLTGAVTVTGEH